MWQATPQKQVQTVSGLEVELTPVTARCMQAMAIRETAEGDIVVTGAIETVALSCSHLLHLLEAGSFSRSTGSLTPTGT
jgi:hypothetical protein